MLCLFSFGIANFWGADIIRGDTVYPIKQLRLEFVSENYAVIMVLF